MSRPMFSCVVPVKGARPYFDTALDSLRSQGQGEDLEIIVQDGDIESDCGLSDAINRGLAKARGEWLFWLNADDILLPGTLEKVRDFVRSSSVDWIAGNTVYIDGKGRWTDSRWNGRWHGFLNRHLPTWTFGPSSFFTRGLWEKHGGLDTSLRFSMDIDLWTRWALAGERYAMIPDYLWGFRWHEGSTTASGRNLAEQSDELRLIEKRHGFSHQGFWRFVSRVIQLLDGSYLRREKFGVNVSGIEVAARLVRELQRPGEVWVHSMWTPRVWCRCLWAKLSGRKLVRMTHGCLDPVRLAYHGWKKRLVAPVERMLFRMTDRIVVTCEAERKWCEEWGVKNEVEVVDLKKYFNLEGRSKKEETRGKDLHVMYLGRIHPLKGIEYLEQAAGDLGLELHVVSDKTGDELEKEWAWCDVLCLPTLSENFGLVVAEALERGKIAVTTDGAPAWGENCEGLSNLLYLKGYREGDLATRVRLLREALQSCR